MLGEHAELAVIEGQHDRVHQLVEPGFLRRDDHALNPLLAMLGALLLADRFGMTGHRAFCLIVVWEWSCVVQEWPIAASSLKDWSLDREEAREIRNRQVRCRTSQPWDPPIREPESAGDAPIRRSTSWPAPRPARSHQ